MFSTLPLGIDAPFLRVSRDADERQGGAYALGTRRTACQVEVHSYVTEVLTAGLICLICRSSFFHRFTFPSLLLDILCKSIQIFVDYTKAHSIGHFWWIFERINFTITLSKRILYHIFVGTCDRIGHLWLFRYTVNSDGRAQFLDQYSDSFVERWRGARQLSEPHKAGLCIFPFGRVVRYCLDQQWYWPKLFN